MEVPLTVASVELDEQVHLFLTSNIVGCAPGEVHSGMRVTVSFLNIDDVWLPMFTPIAEVLRS
jgi:hypothetical protein